MKGITIMRKATLLVIRHIYRDEDSIQTVLRYAIDSRFAITLSTLFET